jgi:hypothetical protein
LKVLQDVWILHKSGIVVFHRPFKESVSPQLFGAMMSALNTFSEQLADGGLSNFELNKKKFTIIKRSNLIFVANSSKQIKQKKINRELEKISKKFLKLYSKDLENYQGRTGAYSQFKEKIEDALEDNTEQS